MEHNPAGTGPLIEWCSQAVLTWERTYSCLCYDVSDNLSSSGRQELQRCMSKPSVVGGKEVIVLSCMQ